MNEPEVWLLEPRRIEAAALDLTVLGEDERLTLSRIDRAGDRVRYAAAHTSLRRLLGERLGVRAADVEFTRELSGRGDPYGRPVVVNPATGIHFSLSYGGDLVLIGIAAAPLGVDIEPVPDAATAQRLTRALHPAEVAEIAADNYLPLTFARIWTRKEAYLKGIGTGLGRALRADYLGLRGLAATPEGWTVTSVSVAERYATAVAVRSER